MGAPTYHRHYRFCAHNNQYSICMDIAVPYTSTVAVMASILAHNVSQSGVGGYSQKNWIGVCGLLPKTLTLFMTKICDFPYHTYDLTKNLIPY